MKPFSLKEYLQNPSKKVVTRNRLPVKICCTNFNGPAPIIAEINSGYSTSFFENGRYSKLAESPQDLFFDTVKREGWANVFIDLNNTSYLGTCIFKSKEEAEEEGKKWHSYIATVKVEWEE